MLSVEKDKVTLGDKDVLNVDKLVVVSGAPGDSGVLPSDFASLLLTISSQVSTLAADLTATKAELRSSVSASASAAGSALAATSVIQAEVHASQQGVGRLGSSLPEHGLIEGMSSPHVAGFSGGSGMRKQERVDRVRGESTETPAVNPHRALSVEARSPVVRRDLSYHSHKGSGRSFPLLPWGQEVDGVSGADQESLSGVHLPDCDGEQDEEMDEGASSAVDDTQLNLPFRLSNAVASAAETAFKYFPEGVVRSKERLPPPLSAFDDFRSSKIPKDQFRFRESSLVAYVMANVFKEKNTPAVPLLSQRGDAPEDVIPWLAKAGERAVSGIQKLRLTPRSISLVETFALPTTVLPVSPELASLREDGYGNNRVVPYSEGSLLALEEAGRAQLELASVSESLQRAHSRSIATSLDPFEFRFEASPLDVSTLFATLAKVTREQMTISANLYAHAVHSRRSAFLTGSRITNKSTIESLKVSPFSEGSLLGQSSLDALQKETQDARDLAIARIASHGFSKSQNKPNTQTQSQSSAKPQTASSGGGRLAEELEAAYWRSEDVFVNYYLRDISSLRQDGSFALPAMHPSPDPMDYLQLANAGHQPPDNSPQLGPGQSTDRSIMLGESGWENTSTATRNSTAVDQNHRDDEMLVFSQVPSQSASAQISAGGDTEDEMLVLSQCPSAQKSYSATSNDDSELEVLDQTELWAKTPEVIDIRTDEDDIIFVSDGCTSAGSTSTAGVNGVDDRAIFQFDSKRTPSGCAKKSPQKTGTGDRTAQVVKSKVNSPKRKRPPAAVGSSPSKGKKARTPTKSCREVLDADSDQLMLIPGTTGRGTKGGQSATVTSAKCTETSSVATTSSTPSKSATSSYTKRTSASATKSKSLTCSSSLSSASSLSSVWPTAAAPSKPVASSHPPSTSAAAASATKSKSSACSSSSSRLSSSQPTNSKAFAHASSQLSSSQPANSASKSKTSARSSSRLSSSQPTNSAANSKNPARSSSSSLISSSQPASSRKRKATDNDDSDCVITVWDHKKELERMSRDVTKDPTKQSLVSTPAKKVQRSLRDWFSPSGKENDGTEVRKKELNAMSKVKRESAIQFQSKSDNLQKRTAEQNLVLSKQSVTECTKQSTTKCTVVLQQLALEERASSSTSSVHKPECASQSFAQKKCTPVSASRVSVQKQCAPQCEPDTTVADCVQEQSTSDGVAGVAMQEETSADFASLVCVERQTAPESMSHLLEQITPRKDSALGAGPSNKPRTESNKSSVACVEGVSGLGTSQSLSSVDTATLTLPTPAALAGVSDPLLLRHPVSTRVTPVNSSMKRIRNSRGKPPAVLSPRPQNNTRIGRRTRNQTDRISKFLATVRRKRKASNQVPDKAQDTSEAGSPLKLETKTVPAKRVKTVRGLSRKLAVENLLQNSEQSTTKCTVVLQQLALEERASSSTSSVHKPERASQSFAQKKCTPVSASRVSVQKQCAPQCEPDTTVADCVQEQSTSDGVAGVAMQEKTSADVASWICVERQTAPESTRVAMQEETSADVASLVCVERQIAPESTRVAMQEETSADVASLVCVERQTAPESMSHLLEQITPRKDSALGAGPSNKPRTESNKSSVACVEGVSGLGTSQSLSSVDTATLTLPTPAALAGVSDPLLLRHPVSTRVTPVNSSMKRIRNSRGKPPAVLSPRPQNNTRIGRRTRNQTDRMSKFLATVRRKRKASNQVPDKAQDTSEAGSPLKLETKTVPAKRVKTVRGLSRKLAVENLLQNSVQSMTKCTVVLQQLALEERASSSTSSVHKPERASQSFAQKKCTPVSASRVSVQKQCAPQCEPDTTVADCVQEQSTSDGVAGVAMQEKTSEDFASLVCVERQTAPESTEVAMQEKTSADVASWVCVERQTAPESTRVAMQEETSADVASWVCVERQTAPESMSHLLEQITPRKDSALGAGPSNKPRTESNKSSVACVEGVSGLGTSQSLSSVDTATLTLPTPAALAGVSDPLLLRHPVCTRVTPVNSSMKRIQNSRGKPPAVLSPRPQNNTRIGRRTRNQTDRMSKFLATVRRKRKASNQVPDKAQDTSEAGSPLKLETKTVPAKRVKTVRGLSRKLAVENLLQNSVQSMTKCTVVLQQLALEERASSSTSSVHKPERASQSFAQKKCTPVSASRVSVQKQCAPQCEPDTTVADCVQEQSTSDGVAGVAMQEETSEDFASLVCVERQTAPESTEVAMQEETSADVASWVCVERQTAPESTSHLLEQIAPRKDSALGASPSNKPRTESNKSSVACVEGVSGLATGLRRACIKFNILSA
ncbi:pneumococcal serine-rich repeat protein-like [Littorina saxatilis]|uniref:pneumococcal serine-rich repeat protein-like n=1 Tax=Littorina saxatilis TaxID=31220 RepID=UPI0038B5785E